MKNKLSDAQRMAICVCSIRFSIRYIDKVIVSIVDDSCKALSDLFTRKKISLYFEDACLMVLGCENCSRRILMTQNK